MTDTRSAGIADKRPTEDAQIFGVFVYERVTRRLSWTPALFTIFGFSIAQVVPTLALMSFHQDPEDRPEWDRAIEQILADGQPLSLWHRIVDTKGKPHNLQTGVVAILDETATVSEIRGVVTDLTVRLRRDRAQEVDRAVTRSTETRAVIDQAKGILMAVLDVDETQAFELLRWHSSYTNVKLRDIAAVIIKRLGDPEVAEAAPRQRLAAILAELSEERRPQLPMGRGVDPVAPPAPTATSQQASTRRIPVSVLPRTMVRAVAAAAQSITIADCMTPDWPLVYVNAAFEKLTGYPAAEILGRNCRFLQGSQTDHFRTSAIRRALNEGSEIKTVLRNYRKDGTPFWNELHLAAVRDDAGRLTHYIGYQSDVTERVEREQQLEHLAYHDASTSLPNQAATVRRLEAQLKTTGGAGFTLAYIRLTGFRSTDGSDDSADVRTVLATVAERLYSALPDDAFLAKADEDAFIMVLPAGDILALDPALDDPIEAETGVAQVVVHVGQARHPADAVDPAGLISAARANGRQS